MLCSEIKSVVYDEQKDQILFEGENGSIESCKVFINNKEKTIRLMDIPVKLDDNIKNQILFAFINKAMLVPGSLLTEKKVKDAINEYTLLFNGYQFNGEPLEYGNKYQKTYTILENFIENTHACDGEPDIITRYRQDLHDICTMYLNTQIYDLVSFKITGKNKIKRVMSYINIIQTYLNKKGYDIECNLLDDILFFKYIKFEIAPKKKKCDIRSIAYNV